MLLIPSCRHDHLLYLTPWNGLPPCAPMSQTKASKWCATMASTTTWHGASGKKEYPIDSKASHAPTPCSFQSAFSARYLPPQHHEIEFGFTNKDKSPILALKKGLLITSPSKKSRERQANGNRAIEKALHSRGG